MVIFLRQDFIKNRQIMKNIWYVTKVEPAIKKKIKNVEGHFKKINQLSNKVTITHTFCNHTDHGILERGILTQLQVNAWGKCREQSKSKKFEAT